MNLISSIPVIGWLIISALFFAGGEFLSKKFALSPNLIYVVWIAILYMLCSLAWLPAILQKNQLAIVGSIWSVLTLLVTVLIGVLVFHEKLGTIGIIGIFFAFIAVALLSMV